LPAIAGNSQRRNYATRLQRRKRMHLATFKPEIMHFTQGWSTICSMADDPNHTPSWHSEGYYKKHPEARPTPKEPAPPKSEPPVSPSVPARKRRPKENPAVAYLNRIGGGLSLVSVVSTFQFPSLYWYSVGAFYAGMVALAVGALLERWPLKHRKRYASGGSSWLLAFQPKLYS